MMARLMCIWISSTPTELKKNVVEVGKMGEVVTPCPPPPLDPPKQCHLLWPVGTLRLV